MLPAVDDPWQKKKKKNLKKKRRRGKPLHLLHAKFMLSSLNQEMEQY